MSKHYLAIRSKKHNLKTGTCEIWSKKAELEHTSTCSCFSKKQCTISNPTFGRYVTTTYIRIHYTVYSIAYIFSEKNIHNLLPYLFLAIKSVIHVNNSLHSFLFKCFYYICKTLRSEKAHLYFGMLFAIWFQSDVLESNLYSVI